MMGSMSTGGLPDIDFMRIRPYGQPASRANAFEELASILIEQGAVEWPAAVRFERFGNPDGGREGRGVLPSGEVWAWQAKYLFEFDSSAASQVTSSVNRALESEPRLKRYFVALPADLPAGDSDRRPKGGRKLVSARTRWEDKVREWGKSAGARGMDVDFVFIGAHELVTALTEPRHAGRLRYWFGADVLTPEWLKRRMDDAIKKAGPRYTREVHVEVSAVQAIDAACRSEAYVRRWQQALASLREARRGGVWSWPDLNGEVLERCWKALDDADATIAALIAAAGSGGDLPDLEGPLVTAMKALDDLDVLVQRRSAGPRLKFFRQAKDSETALGKTAVALGRARHLAGRASERAAAARFLVLAGRGGAGKTHLLCGAASRRTASGQPAIMLFGQDFSGRSPISQIGECSQLGGSLDDVLGLLDAAGEAAGCAALLVIDAINESEHPKRWQDDLRVLAAMVRRHPRVAVIVSCRSEYLGEVVGDTQLPLVEHSGFGEATGVAVRRYAAAYGIELPTFPLLNPEFSNPLYLKLTCRAVQTLGKTRFPLGTAALTTVVDAFIDAVNAHLSDTERCDYDPRLDLVGQCVRQLAGLDRDTWQADEVRQIAEGLLPGRSWSRSLMNGLICEGIIRETHDRWFTFGYQRLGDVARAAAVAGKSAEGIREWLKELGDESWTERGVLSALAVMVPERHGQELVDLDADEEGKVAREVIDGFLDSLLLRAPESVTSRTVELAEKILSDGHRADELLDALVRTACIPGHGLNAEWLHGYLTPLDVADRDVTWTAWLTGGTDAEADSSVRRLIGWAWPDDRQGHVPVAGEVAFLAVITLGWFLTATDRQVRDMATKALTCIAERQSSAFGKALTLFRGVNDPYVTERLAAAACGAALRTTDAATLATIADAALMLAGDQWPQHLLTRDYIKRVLAAAGPHGWRGPDRRPPSASQWPVPSRTAEEIEALAGPPGYEYSSIWDSLTGMGDFGKYILRTALRNVASDDPQSLEHAAERAIFDRVTELGWTPERFRTSDRSRSWDRNRPVERVGKKYQWIGFYEVLGRIVDHQQVTDPLRGAGPGQYEYPEQLIYRDIDPTVLVRSAADTRPKGRPWFSPAEAGFSSAVVDDYPSDMAQVPDPLDLIAVQDPEGVPWLVLATHPQWKQGLAPEAKALGVKRREAWMHITGYLVPIASSTSLRSWAPQQSWEGRWMPDPPDAYNVLLGSYPDDPRWSAADGTITHWDQRPGGTMPDGLTLAAAAYNGTGTDRDASAPVQAAGYVPSRQLHTLLGRPSGVDFTWADGSEIALQDPSAAVGGPQTLAMRRDLVPRLTDAGLTIFWTVLVGNELYSTDPFARPGDEYRWVGASASYILNGDSVELISATANRFTPGPETERSIDWKPREGEQ
jgi:hypothetical protein